MPIFRIHFSGRVQGVGFRATCRNLARQLPALAGHVRNLPDGRVELVVCGTNEDVNRFVENVQRTFSGYIDDVQKSEVPPAENPLSKDLSGIEITYR